MNKLLKVYIYAIPVLYVLGATLALILQNPRILVSGIISALIVLKLFYDLKNPTKYTDTVGNIGVFYGFVAVILVFISITVFDSFFSLEGVIFLVVILFCSTGCYLLMFSKTTKLELDLQTKRKLQNEYKNREYYYDLGKFKIYRSKNFYWHEDTPFSSLKELEETIKKE